MKTYLLIVGLLISSFSFAQNKKDTTINFKVSGSCAMCEKRITDVALKNGAKEARWNSQTQLLTVSFNQAKVTKEKLQEKIAEVGHDTEPFLAPDEVYNTLPECCLYRITGSLCPGFPPA